VRINGYALDLVDAERARPEGRDRDRLRDQRIDFREQLDEG